MPSSDPSWWERHLGGVTRAIPPQQPTQQPSYQQPAVRWREPQYPPTGPATQGDATTQPEGNGDATYQRVRAQGWNSKKPQSVGRVGECPECGGSNFFQRKWARTEAAPICTDCGYNGDYFTQSGSMLNAMGVTSSTPVAFARTDNPSGEPHFGVDPSVPSDFSFNSVR